MKRKWQIISLCVSFIIGIVVSANYLIPVNYWIFTGLILCSVIGLVIVKHKLGYVLFVVIGLLLGIVRFEIFVNSQLPSAARFENQKISVIGKVEGEPRWDQYRNYVFYLSDPAIDGIRAVSYTHLDVYKRQVQNIEALDLKWYARFEQLASFESENELTGDKEYREAQKLSLIHI